MMRLGCRGAVMRPLQWSYRAPLQRAYSEEVRTTLFSFWASRSLTARASRA